MSNESAYEYLKRFIWEATMLSPEEQAIIKKLSPHTNEKRKLKPERKTIMFDEDLNLEYPDLLAPLIDAVKKGYKMPKEIGAVINCGNWLVTSHFISFANYLIDLQLLKPKGDKCKRERVIDFIQSRLLDKNYVETASVEPETEPEKPESVRPVRVIPKTEEIQPKNNPTISELKMLLDSKITKLQAKRALLEELEKELIC